MYKILIVEDDEVISSQLKRQLEKWGYCAVIVEDFMQVMAAFAKEQPHLVLMDIGLPFYNGHYWCQQIRAVSKIPIIFLSSASDKMNIVMAMNMGGDDFITKPFDIEVLLAKLGAILRRTYDFQGEMNLLEHRGILLNLSDFSMSVAGRKIELSKNEFRILEMLFANKGKVVSREALMKKLWDSDCFIDDNTLTVNITRLRRKIEEEGVQDLIMTKKGIGYYLGEA